MYHILPVSDSKQQHKESNIQQNKKGMCIINLLQYHIFSTTLMAIWPYHLSVPWSRTLSCISAGTQSVQTESVFTYNVFVHSILVHSEC